MQEQVTRIACNERIADHVFCLRFQVAWTDFDPGQFVMVRIPEEAVFLRRPFGIVDLSDGLAEISYKVVGKGTEALSRAPVGTSLRVIGPCGKGFCPPDECRTALLVAGGYGIGPLVGLARKLQTMQRKTILFSGAKSASELLYGDVIARDGIDCRVATEDGSAGKKGRVTELVARELSSVDQPALFACGPEGMLEAVARLGRASAVPTQVSLDRYMACGIGVCMGCACKRRDGSFVRTCREGPVFEASELLWDKSKK